MLVGCYMIQYLIWSHSDVVWWCDIDILNFKAEKKSQNLPYLFGYKTEFFSFQNNPKDLDLPYKTDLDLLDCLGRVKLVL